jgi:hypothetical protein
MNTELSIPEKFKFNADLVVQVIAENCSIHLAFDQSGVDWIDGYINRLRLSTSKDKHSAYVSTLASFIGECIIKTYGGSWIERDGSWGVQVNNRIWACPFAKVAKQFDNGPEDSVKSFFSCIPIVDKHSDTIQA